MCALWLNSDLEQIGRSAFHMPVEKLYGRSSLNAKQAQAHVLLTTKVHEPTLARAMAAAAAMLSPHALHLCSSVPLLPKADQLKQPNAQTGWRLEESALGNAASGAQPGIAPPAQNGLGRAELMPESTSNAAKQEARQVVKQIACSIGASSVAGIPGTQEDMRWSKRMRRSWQVCCSTEPCRQPPNSFLQSW